MSNNNLSIEGARIIFPNFSGKEGQFNAAGDRNFCIILDDDALVLRLIDDGWNVRFLRPRDPVDEPKAYIQVKVSYKNRPPKVVLIRSGRAFNLDEDSINILDWAEIEHVDVIINPHQWTIGDRTGIKGYLKAIYVTIAEDEFAAKYEACETSARDDLPF